MAPLVPKLSPATRDRLHRALSVVYGIEPYVVLKDIWGVSDREVERIAMWMAEALVDAALRESADMPKAEPAPAAAKRTARRKSVDAA
jgi:hypothetical protein